MAAHSLSQIADESRVFNAMEKPTAHARGSRAALETQNTDMSDTPELTEPEDRLADLRRRRTELVDVLADTLLERVLKAPRGPRRPGATSAARGGGRG